MPFSTSGICEECGQRFMLAANEVTVLPTMRSFSRPPTRKEPSLNTWMDWVEHVTTHCEKHRRPIPPQACLDDFKMHAMMRRSGD
jgi:hypothetical protein